MFKTPLTGFFVKENPRGEKAYVPRVGTPYDNMRNLSTHLDWLVKLADLLPALISVPMHLVGTGLILGRINDNICYVPKLIKDPTNTYVPTYTVVGLPAGWNFNTNTGVITRSLVNQDLRDYGNIVITAHCGPSTVHHFVDVKILPELPTAPIITVLGSNPLISVLNTSYTDPGATALDIVDGDISSQIQVQGVVDTADAGTYNIIYSVTNSLGTTSTATRVVVVAASTAPPVIVLSGANSATVLQGIAYVEPGYTATDAEDGDITAGVVVTGNVDTTTPGTYTLTYTSTDSHNNVSTAIRTIVVASNTVPAINLTGSNPFIVYLGIPYTEPGVTATDAEDGDISDDIVTTGVVDHNTLGNYTLTYTVSDSNGNTTNIDRTVNVVANNSPVITLTGSAVTIITGDTYVEPGYAAIDVEDGDLTAGVVVTGILDTNTIGTYILTYSVTDSHNNVSTATRTVNVIPPNTPPVINLVGANPSIVYLGIPYTEPGFTANDSEDGDLTGSVNVTGSVDHNSLGNYTLTYTVTDSDGNTISIDRAVNVIANNSPVITLMGANPLNILQDL